MENRFSLGLVVALWIIVHIVSSTVYGKTSPENTGPCHFWRRQECAHWGPSEERRGWSFVLATNASGMLHLRAVCSFLADCLLACHPYTLLSWGVFVRLRSQCRNSGGVFMTECLLYCSFYSTPCELSSNNNNKKNSCQATNSNCNVSLFAHKITQRLLHLETTACWCGPLSLLPFCLLQPLRPAICVSPS